MAIDSIHEQLAAAIASSLAEIIAGDDYHLTPGVVTRSSWDEGPGPESAPLLDPSIVGPIYAVRAGDEEHNETVGLVVEALADMHILLAVRFEDAESPQEPASPMRATVVNRMVRDVLRKLLQDVQLLSLGGAVENVFAGPVIVDRDRFLAGWALAEITFASSYRYVGGIP